MRALMMVLVAGLLVACSDTQQTATEPACVKAQAWVNANLNALPTTLPEFSKHPKAYRTAIYNALTPGQRLGLWESHLKLFAEAHPEYTAEQKAYVQDLRTNLPKYLVADTATLWAITRRGTDLLGKRDAGVALIGMGQPIVAASETLDEGELECDCCIDGAGCQWWACFLGMYGCCYRTYMGGQECKHTTWGCGTFFTQNCDGHCVFDENWGDCPPQ